MNPIENIRRLIHITDFTPTEKLELIDLFLRFDAANQNKLLELIIEYPDLLRLLNENLQIKNRARISKNNNLWQSIQRHESDLLRRLEGEQ